MKRLFKITSIILIQVFLLLDVAWAGDMLSIKQADCLSPSLNIDSRELLNYFELLSIEEEMKGLINTGTFKELEFEKVEERLEKIFRRMGVGVKVSKQKKSSEKDIFADIKTAFKQGQDIRELSRQKEAELKKIAGWVRKDKKELVRDKALLRFLENNQLPILRRASDAEIRELANEEMIKKMAELAEVLDNGSQQKVLELIADTLAVIEDIMYPDKNFPVGFFVINREELKHWIKKIFFWENHRKNPHASPVMFWDLDRAYVGHVKAYVKQRNLEEALEKIRKTKREKLEGFKRGYVLDHIWIKRHIFLDKTRTENLISRQDDKNKLQLNALATISALALAFGDKIQTFIYNNQQLVHTVGFSVGALTIAYLFYQFMKSKKFNRMMSPLHTKWYVWRLRLKQENPVDGIIMEMVRETQKREQLIKEIRGVIKYLQDEERKQNRTIKQQAIDELLAEKLKKILFFRLKKMGTDSYYFRKLYRFYSRYFRVRKLKRELQLNPIDNEYDREFLSHVQEGWDEETLIHEYLELNLKSALESRRKYARKMLEKFVQAGMLSRDEFIQMSMDVLKSGSAEAAKDVILGFENHVNGLDEHLREKVLMHLKVNLENHRKRIKQAQASAKKNKEYFKEVLKVRKNEGKRIQNLLNSVAGIILQDMARQEDIDAETNIAMTLNSVISDMDEDLLKAFKQRLMNISTAFGKDMEEINQQLKRESMISYLMSVIRKNGANDKEREETRNNRALFDVLKSNKREIDRMISSIEKILNKKVKKNNNAASTTNNNLSVALEKIKKIAPMIKNLPPFNYKAPNLVSQAI